MVILERTKFKIKFKYPISFCYKTFYVTSNKTRIMTLTSSLKELIDVLRSMDKSLKDIEYAISESGTSIADELQDHNIKEFNKYLDK